MTTLSKFLWVSASPSLKYFHRRLIANLSTAIEVEFWEYAQTLDEIGSIEGAVKLLRTHLANAAAPVHLIGHGIGGTIALVYARMYPIEVASLTLLSVAVRPGISWHSYYYDRLWSSTDSRSQILKSIATDLFPDNSARHVCDLVERMERDLVESPSSHSLFKSAILPAGGVDMPLMICGCQSDPIFKSSALSKWINYFKPVDEIWRISNGGHFFHHIHSELVSYHIQNFWQKLEPAIIFHQPMKVELN